MTTHRDPTSTPGTRFDFASVFLTIAWGRTVITVLVGATLGSAYSLANRPVTAAPPPVELAASVAQQPVVGTRERLFETMVTEFSVPDRPLVVVADMIMLPVPASKSLRDVSLQPLPPQTAELPTPMGFRSIATLSAPSPRLESEVRALKGRNDEDSAARGTGKADAVAAVWGFLAVGLGGSTATAATRPSARQPR